MGMRTSPIVCQGILTRRQAAARSDNTARRHKANGRARSFLWVVAGGLFTLYLVSGCQMHIRLMTDAQTKDENMDRVKWNRSDRDLKVTHRGIYRGSAESKAILAKRKNSSP